MFSTDYREYKSFLSYFDNCLFMFFRSQVISSQVRTRKCWPAFSQQPVYTQDALIGTRFKAEDGANFTAAGEEFSCCGADTRYDCLIVQGSRLKAWYWC